MIGQRLKFVSFDLSFRFGRLGFVALFAALILVLMAALPIAQAKNGRCRIWNYQAYYWMPGSGFISGDQPLFENRNCEGPSRGIISFGPDGAVDSGDRESAAAKCNEHNGHSNNTVKPFGLLWGCYPGDDSTVTTTTTTTTTNPTTTTTTSTATESASNGGSGGGGATNGATQEVAAPGQMSMRGVQVAAEMGLGSGIHFKRLTVANVGIQSVVDRGVLDVVDVWGYANQNFEVCFAQSGTIVFLDAAASPRTEISVSSYLRDGYTCATMNRAGTMVLVQGSGESSTNAVIVQTIIHWRNDPVSSAIDLRDCVITPPYNLNVRRQPWGGVLGIVHKDEPLSPLARTESWFLINFYHTQCWIAAWLTDFEAKCEWEPATEDGDGPSLASIRLVPADMYLSVT